MGCTLRKTPYSTIIVRKEKKPGADPGFPLGGGANSPGETPYDFAKFSKKLNEIEEIFGRRAGAGARPQICHCKLIG